MNAVHAHKNIRFPMIEGKTMVLLPSINHCSYPQTGHDEKKRKKKKLLKLKCDDDKRFLLVQAELGGVEVPNSDLKSDIATLFSEAKRLSESMVSVVGSRKSLKAIRDACLL